MLSLEDRSKVDNGRGSFDAVDGADVELRLVREEMLVLGSMALSRGCAQEIVAKRKKRQMAHVWIRIPRMLAFMIIESKGLVFQGVW